MHCFDFCSFRFHLNTSTCFFPDERKVNELPIKTNEFAESTWHESILQPYLDSMQLKSESILVAESFDIAEYNTRNPNNPLKVLDERIIEKRTSFIYDPEQFVLLTLIEKRGKLLSENGILHKLIAKSVHLENLKPQPEPEDPKVLGMKHVGVGFKIFGMSLGISLFVFVLERLKPFIKIKIVHYLIDLFL